MLTLLSMNQHVTQMRGKHPESFALTALNHKQPPKHATRKKVPFTLKKKSLTILHKKGRIIQKESIKKHPNSSSSSLSCLTV